MDKNLEPDQPADPVRPLLVQFARLLAQELRPLLAQQRPAAAELPTRRLLTLNELVALLPTGKKAQTWRAWIYQRSRLGQVPGCHKIGGRLFFNPNQTLPWLLNPATNGQTGPGLDLSGQQSLHVDAMPETATNGADRGGAR